MKFSQCGGFNVIFSVQIIFFLSVSLFYIRFLFKSFK